MSSSQNANLLVNFSSDNKNKFNRNFLSKVVCEFRFPTLMELGESKPPSSFVKALRKEYPHLELQNEVTITAGSSDSNNTHIFKSQKSNWIVSLRQSSFSIETSSYTHHEKMMARISEVLKAAFPIIDTEIFTRVGMRYINLINVGEDPIDGWINDALVAPIKSKNFRGIREFAGKIVSDSEDGGFTLQHKIHLNPESKDKNPAMPSYYIDIDVFRTEVEVNDVSSILNNIHNQAFNLFDWCAGEKLRYHLKD